MSENRNLEIGRTVKVCVSAIVFFGLFVSRVLSRLLGIRRPARCVVLYYHSVPASFRDRFAKQLDIILQHSEPVHPSRTDSLKPGRQYSLVTFDDGFSNFFDVALPELAGRKIPALMFIITEAIGRSFGPAKSPERVMTAEQLGTLPESLVALGSHTLTHPYLPDSGEKAAQEEIMQSRVVLEKLLKKPVHFFSFPFGGLTPGLVSICKQAGYARVFSTLPKATSFADSEYCIGRVRVDPWDWPLEFRLKLAGAYDWLPAAISIKRRLYSNPLVTALRRPEKSYPGVKTRQSYIHS